jgi:arylsulfatase A-like enzyme
MVNCLNQKNENNLKKLDLKFKIPENYDIISLIDLFKSSSITYTGEEKPSIISINKNIKAIVQSPASSIDYYINIPENGRLIFSLYAENPVQFKIWISSAEKDSELIFSENFNKPEKKSLIYELNLIPYYKKIMKFSFQIEGKGKGFWLNPMIIYRREGFSKKRYLKFCEELKEKAKKWNLIYIVLDSARPDHFSCYGYKYKTTLNIDRIARKSLVFQNAFAQAVYTLASTSSLFTGLYPVSHYVVMDYQKLSDSFYTLAEAFRDKGYLTLAETSNPYVSEKFNMNQGFIHFEENWKTENILLKSKTIKLIKERKKRFFLYLHYTSPHAPYNPPLRFKRKFGAHLCNKKIGTVEYLEEIEKGKIELKEKDLDCLIKLYDANLNYVDYYIGKVINLLKKENLLDNSVLVISSDHGEALFEHGKIQHNTTVYEEMIKIPLIIKFPDESRIKPRRIPYLVEIVDLTTTFFDLFELPKKMNYSLEGKSLLPLIFSNQPVKDFIFSRTIIPLSLYCIRSERYKYILNLNNNCAELYDLKSDPGEKINLISNRFIASFLHQYLLNHLLSAQKIKKGKEKYIEIDEKTRERLRSLGYLD